MDIEYYRLRHLRILLVEDDLNFQNVMCHSLRSLARLIEVDCCTSAGDALIRLHTNRNYDLIILDNGLEGTISGLFLWKECKKQFPHVPSIMVSGLPVQDFLSASKEYNDYPTFLPKPFRSCELKAAILGVLKNQVA